MLNSHSTTIPVGANTLLSALDLSFGQFGPNVAIETVLVSLTYAELDRVTASLAKELSRRFTSRELQAGPIAILMSRSVEFYVAQISVLRAGGFFLPIDPRQPSERIEFLLADSGSPLVLVRKDDSFQASGTVEQFEIDASVWQEPGLCGFNELAPSHSNAPSLGVQESDFAYMIYTSGSTGKPKGVPIHHAAIWNFCHWWSEQFGISDEDRCLQMCSLGFDASLEEILTTLVSGGCLVPAPDEALSSIAGFLEFIQQRRITVLHLPAAFWHTLTDGLSARDSHAKLELATSVRTVVFGGEQVDDHQVQAWFECVPLEVRLINAYGPTETTIGASYATLSPGNTPSIGLPIEGVSFYVVDQDGQLVETGQPGELYIGGVGVATKYWRREQLSAEKFISCPFHLDGNCFRTGDRVRVRNNGNYEFLGRMDDQIKLRGYRIEPGEISHCLGTHTQVSQAHVKTSRSSMVGYAVLQPGAKLSESQLKEFLAQRLPAYMVPTRIVIMDAFPVTPGGKLDRNKFPDPVAVHNIEGDEQPQSDTERITAQIWEKVLRTSGLKRQDNFFEIGGDSLSAMRLILSLEAAFPGPPIPVTALIPNPTLCSLAAFIDQRQLDAATQIHTVVKSQPLLIRLGDATGAIKMVCVHAAGGSGMFYRQLYQGLDQVPPSLVLESAFLHGKGPVVCPQQSIAEVAQQYVECILKHDCDEELTMVGYSLGGLLAFEMAALLTKQGIRVGKIINIDAPNPQAIQTRDFFPRAWHNIQRPISPWLHFVQLRKNWQRWRQISKIRQRKHAGVAPPVALRPLALEMEYRQIAKHYNPSSCDVPMVLICGQDEPSQFYLPADYGWTSKVSQLTVTQVPGGHESIFSAAHIEHLRTAFYDAIRMEPVSKLKS